MEKRIAEIQSSIKNFQKDLYSKSEVLPELLSLQSELVNLTFNGDHAESSSLRIWDIESHFDRLNEECGHVVDAELEKFKAGCKVICNTIKAEMSGQAGEFKARRALETMRCKHVILKNVEFKLGDHRTELDMVVITEKAVFIIEVKNSTKDIYIDERGNYCRVKNDTLFLDNNIGEKMNDKEYLLREALKQAGIEDINIVSLVVFTNNLMQVENRFPYITTCYLSELPRRIDGYAGKLIYSEELFEEMVSAIEDNKCHEEYPMPIDMQEFKRDFATVMAILEKAKETKEAQKHMDADDVEETAESCDLTEKDNDAAPLLKKHTKSVVRVASLVGVVALSVVTGIAVLSRRK